MFRLLGCLSLAATALAQFAINPNVLNGHSGLGRIENVTTMHLSALGIKDEFVALRHPGFPAHQVRVKKTNFCDPTVK